MRPVLFLPLTTLLFLPSCGEKEAAGPSERPPAAVTVQPAITETVRITRDLPGRISAFRTAQVRARVSGILLEKDFVEGGDVEAGALLFKIDPAPLEAIKDNAAASLARAEANYEQAEKLFSRYESLAKTNAVSQKDYDNAESTVKIAGADVQAATAALKTAELNLGYASVTAPIAGRVGKAQVTEGALVGEGEATQLALIQQLDPIYFDFTQSSSDLIALKRAMKSGEISQDKSDAPQATLLLEDGSEYPESGKILFSEATVDESTGMVSLRAEFPNPDRLLLPGMFARARIVQAVRENVVTVPQRAVTRVQGGMSSVMVVDKDDLAQLRTIKTSNAVDDKWIVISGLEAGEKVIMEGHLKARPGTTVVSEPFTPKTAETAPSQTAASKG